MDKQSIETGNSYLHSSFERLTFFFSPSRLRVPLLESEGMNFKIDVVLGLAVEVERQEHRWMGLERRVMSVRVQMLYLK